MDKTREATNILRSNSSGTPTVESTIQREFIAGTARYIPTKEYSSHPAESSAESGKYRVESKGADQEEVGVHG
ncbi:hypothetical protein DPMN_023794 [Dreissena polymorpha]|uniref:Uncharacterized protein n=1 Tax=Dreissena polymorpha TaxID=45954 RepID=A0A9D4LMX0_DREPO|nr:hypothetical protein DPMN_023794 [Dreissena polymorpha]